MKECLFCSIVKENKPFHEIVWQDENHIAFLDAYPFTEGHTLVIPKKHTDYVFDLPEAEYHNLLTAAKKVSIILKKATNTERIGMAVTGFSVPHIHVHLVPLNTEDQIFVHKEKDPVLMERISETAKKIRAI